MASIQEAIAGLGQRIDGQQAPPQDSAQYDSTAPPPPPLSQSVPHPTPYVLHSQIDATPLPVVAPIQASEDAHACMDKLEQMMRQMRVSDGDMSWDDFDGSPVASLPTQFRMSEIERYTGIGCPKIHLRLYSSMMRAHRLDEAHLIMLFPMSLSGAAQRWFASLDASRRRTWDDLAQEFLRQFAFNTVIDVSRRELEALRQGPDESVTSFISRWREKIAQIVDRPFENDQIREEALRRIETRRCAISSVGLRSPRRYQTFGQTSLAYYRQRYAQYRPPRPMTPTYLHQTPEPVFAAQVSERPPTLYPRPRAPQTTILLVQRPTRQFSQLGMPLSRAFQKLMEGGLLTQLAPRPDLIDQGLVNLGQPSVTTNPLLAHSTHAVPPPPGGIHHIDFVEDDSIHMMSWDDGLPEPIVLDDGYEVDTVGSQTFTPFSLISDWIPFELTPIAPSTTARQGPPAPFILRLDDDDLERENVQIVTRSGRVAQFAPLVARPFDGAVSHEEVRREDDEILRQLQSFEPDPRRDHHYSEGVDSHDDGRQGPHVLCFHPEWLANVVPVPKKDGKVRVCVDFRDLNKASPKDDFPLPHIDLLVDSTAGHSMLSFMDGFSGYNQILMAPEDMEKAAFITEWDTYCYRVMPFGLKNVEATYQRAATTLCHDMMHKDVEVYVDDMIVKSRGRVDHLAALERFFERIRKFRLRLNPKKCTFGVTSGKLLRHMVSDRGIEVDLDKIKAILDMPVPRTEKEIRGFLGRLQYISRFIARLTDILPPMPGRPLLLYLSVSDMALGCMLAQLDDSGKERAIYYLSKRMLEYEMRYVMIERMCLTLVWATRRLRHYMTEYSVCLISRLDPLKYLFDRPALTGRLMRWLVLLTEFDIQYVSQKSIKGSIVADHLASLPISESRPVDDDFPDEEFIAMTSLSGWRMYFDGAANQLGFGIGVLLISPQGDHIPRSVRLVFSDRHPTMNNIVEYEACILGLETALELGIRQMEVFGDSNLVLRQIQRDWKTRDVKLRPYHAYLELLVGRFDDLRYTRLPRAQNQFADALTTLASSVDISIDVVIRPLLIESRSSIYPEAATTKDRRALRQLATRFVICGETLYRRSADDCCRFVQRCPECQTHGDLIHAPPSELHALTSPWPFSVWGIDIIGKVSPKSSSGHEFILVAIDYFTKWVEATSYAKLTSARVTSFIRSHIICRYRVPHELISDRGTNGAVEAANKNIKKILRKMVETSRDWPEKLPFALWAYRTSFRTSTGATPYSLVYGMEAVLPVEIEMGSLRVALEQQISETEWAQARFDQLNLLDERRLRAVDHV
ncbi:Retrovirus-related Pol polyprotein from transposon 17.6 [Vitis vinifera]|uniref:Retrovirus-related Pol polyprotein from transposon 17.6 n=1 Tax=Vitis vinifera TaxID=29760 RepID=A0A438BXK1_VITVI|nr:Retrovirus-related Pol polyprotein from transposon 17.6 [Vitis vinifera]